MEKDVIKLESSYWDAEGFKESVKQIKSLIVELLNNADKGYYVDAGKLGGCLFSLDMLEQHEILDSNPDYRGCPQK